MKVEIPTQKCGTDFQWLFPYRGEVSLAASGSYSTSDCLYNPSRTLSVGMVRVEMFV